MREGVLQIGFGGLAGNNPSLRRPPRPFFSVKLKHLGHLGLKIPALYTGGTMTWDDFGALGVQWGNNTQILYTKPLPGWTYRWEYGERIFYVTDDQGTVTVANNIKTLSDLGITWDIFESPQFTIHLTAKFENDAFLIGWHKKKNDPEYPDPDGDRYVTLIDYAWAQGDKGLNNTMHPCHYSQLISINTEVSIYEDTLVGLDITGLIREIILAKIIDLSVTGEFPIGLLLSDKGMTGAKKSLTREGYSFVVGQLLMIHVFASISNASKPVFEPWMLWKIFQWVGKGNIVITRDRTFDLSPWWG